MASVLFITYRTLPYTNGLNIGVHDVYVHSGTVYHPARSTDQVIDEIRRISEIVTPEITMYNKIVLYIGATGSEEMINIVRGIPAEKVVFVTCDCDLYQKRELFDDAGFSESEVVLCDCRDSKVMPELITAYLHQKNLKLAYGECTEIAQKTRKRVLEFA